MGKGDVCGRDNMQGNLGLGCLLDNTHLINSLIDKNQLIEIQI